LVSCCPARPAAGCKGGQHAGDCRRALAELRDADDLTWADQEAWDYAFTDAITAARAASIDPVTGKRRTVVAADGSEVPLRVRPDITPEMLQRRLDDLLASLITSWSLDVPLPFTPAVRPDVPRLLGRALAHALSAYTAALSAPYEPETGEVSRGRVGRCFR